MQGKKEKKIYFVLLKQVDSDQTKAKIMNFSSHPRASSVAKDMASSKHGKRFNLIKKIVFVDLSISIQSDFWILKSC